MGINTITAHRRLSLAEMFNEWGEHGDGLWYDVVLVGYTTPETLKLAKSLGAELKRTRIEVWQSMRWCEQHRQAEDGPYRVRIPRMKLLPLIPERKLLTACRHLNTIEVYDAGLFPFVALFTERWIQHAYSRQCLTCNEIFHTARSKVMQTADHEEVRRLWLKPLT